MLSSLGENSLGIMDVLWKYQVLGSISMPVRLDSPSLDSS